ncbi:tetratricopeptide repeat protein [Magnetospirillum sp. 15-1]|uniref:O-linked N-acetylglucosamine transferase, SPINDLY family protein n=1 Tax=Magnetospirillum sp. 15-1 TaxID=1979370 RepID=UPI000BBBFC9D|nr:tetratricopeptide repeat protein [Magnetospirillum sp. 15-1]
MIAQLFADYLRKAAKGGLSVPDAMTAAAELADAGEHHLAAQLYRTWIEACPGDPLLFAICFNLGIILMQVNDHQGAQAAFQRAIEANPGFYPSYISLGNSCEAAGAKNLAVEHWLRLSGELSVITRDNIGHKLSALKQVGRVLEEAQSDEAAETVMRQSLDVDANQHEIIQHWVHLRQRQCKWPSVVELPGLPVSRVMANMAPLAACGHGDDPLLQLAVAQTYTSTLFGASPVLGPPPETLAREDGARLKIGYVSSDMRNHAVGYLMVDLLERHDPNKVEVFIYYCGINVPDATQARIKAASEHWRDITHVNDRVAYDLIRQDGIQILVDLNGHTQNSRTALFAARPAPLQVNWLGYPGTMGSWFHDYIIGDEFIIPKGFERFYSERVARLPCYQPNDRHRLVSPVVPTRAEEGLPEQGMVFCCFNGQHKFSAAVFARWMAILSQVSGSVLWLLSAPESAMGRLRQMAAENFGIDPSRLIFGGRRDNVSHLARYPLADLFLDTVPYGAHTTTSDALWMGVPVLTLPGKAFAARVCASLVTAAGMPDMVCASGDEYFRRAVEIGNNPGLVAELKARVQANRNTCTLFDTDNTVMRLEELFDEMWRDYRSSGRPRPNLINVDPVFQVAATATPEMLDGMGFEAYRDWYREQLVLRGHSAAFLDEG